MIANLTQELHLAVPPRFRNGYCNGFLTLDTAYAGDGPTQSSGHIVCSSL
jgi:hypothetical protein